MKKSKIIISLAGLVVAVATIATVAAYTLGGDGSRPPANESVGTQEPTSLGGQPLTASQCVEGTECDDTLILHDDSGLPTSDPGPGQISNGGGSASVTNPGVRGSISIPDPGVQTGELVKIDDPPPGKVVSDEGRVVPIDKFDDDRPTRDPDDSGVPAVHPQPWMSPRYRASSQTLNLATA